MRFANVLIFFFISSLLVIGCANTNSTPVTTPDPTKTTTPVPPTQTTTSTSTRKPAATFPPTRTSLPPQTDLPTIEPSNINAIISSLYSKCKFPCWGNVIPGKTSQYAAKRFLTSLGEWNGNDNYQSVTFQDKNIPISISVDLTSEYGLIDSIRLPSQITKPYRINRLFTEYGSPEDVQLEILPLTAELTSYFWLILKYPQQGFFAVISARGTVVNSIINVCPRNISPDLYLFESNKYSLDEMNKIISEVQPHSTYQPLNVLTDMGINQFYETFRSQGADCIATNIKFQLP